MPRLVASIAPGCTLYEHDAEAQEVPHMRGHIEYMTAHIRVGVKDYTGNIYTPHFLNKLWLPSLSVGWLTLQVLKQDRVAKVSNLKIPTG